ncbi:hypothetical protein [Rhizobium aouanii]|uniref:Uncharacterized protein n=1 Tax=Rhizobium aouanii TaxID=3118145 RepID=A0ABU8CHZ5_9HYPH
MSRRMPSARLQSAEAEETQNREHDNDSADKPDQIVHGNRSPVEGRAIVTRSLNGEQGLEFPTGPIAVACCLRRKTNFRRYAFQ